MQVYNDFLGCSRACSSKVTDPIWPEFEFVRYFMPVLVTRKFDVDPIKNETASLETPFSHSKSMGPNSEESGPMWPKFELVQVFMPVLVTYKFDKDQIKTQDVSMETWFSPL